MSLKNAPIKRKLMTVILLTSGIVLFLTCTTFFIYEFITFRQDTLSRLSTLGTIVADNSTAAMIFDSPEDATEILSALKAEPHVVAAILYDKQGQLFAKYPETLAQGSYPTHPGSIGFLFKGAHLEGFQPVIQNQNKIGTLYLQSDLTAIYDRFELYGGIVLLVLLLSFMIAYAVSNTLQKQISKPILALAETAKAISERRDYSVRAKKIGTDEVGLFTDAFNQMLAQIHAQDTNLRESEERFRLMVVNVMDYAIIMLDPTGHVITWNIGAERIEGYRADEILGQHFSCFHMRADVAMGEPELRLEVAARQGRVEYEGWRVRKDGTSFYANIVLTAIRDESGKLQGFSKVTRDMTERKKSEDDIRQLNADLETRVKERTAELEGVNKELEAFSYSVSHDLRTPLRAIDGFGQVLLEDYNDKLDAEGKDSLNRIREATQHMGRLIDDMLQLAHVTRSALQKQPTNFSLIAADVVEWLQRSYPNRKVDIQIQPDIKTEADQRLLRIVLENLIGNSWKYSSKRENAQIKIGVFEINSVPTFFIRDNGAGFDMKYYNKLFGAFQRLHETHEFHGTGIGLATVHRIISRHGGMIWAEGKVDHGATFYFTLEHINESHIPKGGSHAAPEYSLSRG